MKALRILLWLLVATPAVATPRLVSTSPQVTELLFELGHGDAIVATSQLSDYPEAAKAIPRLGPLFMPSLERTLFFQADWVLFDDTTTVPVFEKGAASAGIRTFKLQTNGVETLLSSAERMLHEVFGETNNAALAGARQAQRRGEGGGRSENFLAFVWLQPPILFGPKTFLSELLEGRRGKNLLPPSWRMPYPQVSEEWLLRRKPERIYVLDDTPDAENTAKKALQRWWPGIAVKLTILSRHQFARATLSALKAAP